MLYFWGVLSYSLVVKKKQYGTELAMLRRKLHSVIFKTKDC